MEREKEGLTLREEKIDEVKKGWARWEQMCGRMSEDTGRGKGRMERL